MSFVQDLQHVYGLIYSNLQFHTCPVDSIFTLYTCLMGVIAIYVTHLKYKRFKFNIGNVLEKHFKMRHLLECENNFLSSFFILGIIFPPFIYNNIYKEVNNVASNEKKKKTWVFVLQKFGKFWIDSLGQ